MNDEWLWVAAICAAPFLFFGAFELASLVRRRRMEAIARRPKHRPEERSSSAKVLRR